MATKTLEVVPDSAQSRLTKLEADIQDLETKRKELLREVAKEEAEGDEKVHKKCRADLASAKEDAEDALEGRHEEIRKKYVQALQRFGGHAPDCISEALVGIQALHPLCTCGWNDVATEVERW